MAHYKRKRPRTVLGNGYSRLGLSRRLGKDPDDVRWLGNWPDDLRAMFEAKFVGPYLAAREVLPVLVEDGSITFFSGVLSRRPSAGATGLSAVNAAVEALAKVLALELAGRARVNCISPGMVATEAYAAMSEEAREGMYAQVGHSLPVGRVGEAEEIAQAVIIAMSNGFMTGSILDVDGGHLVRD